MIGIVVADDHEVVRTGFASMLGTQPDFNVLGTARTARRRCWPAASSAPTWS